MQKIKSLFVRDYQGDIRLVTEEVVADCLWVLNGEGIATRKYDGTACLVKDQQLFKRYDAKNGKAPPIDFIPAQDPDHTTGHRPGWVPVGNAPEDKYHLEAFKGTEPNATYELCGPKINGNPEKLEHHVLIRHGVDHLFACPLTFNELKEYLRNLDIEGIVWHHPDGRMAKIKKKDFGFKR